MKLWTPECRPTKKGWYYVSVLKEPEHVAHMIEKPVELGEKELAEEGWFTGVGFRKFYAWEEVKPYEQINGETMKRDDNIYEAAPEGLKFDKHKTRYGLIPVEALRMVAEVLTYGATKYSDNNWRRVLGRHARYTDAALRHGEAYRGGEKNDPETGFNHLAHRICCDLFLLQLDIEHKRSDAEIDTFTTSGNAPLGRPVNDILMEADSEGYPIRLRQVKKFSDDSIGGDGD